MAAGDYIQGDALLLKIHDGTAYRPIACITSNDLSSTAEVIETKTKCAPGVVGKEYGSVNKSISIEGYYLDTTSAGGDSTKASHDYLQAKQDAVEKVTIQFEDGLETAAPKYGTAIISDLSLSAPAGEKSTFSATLDIDGGLSVTDPHA